jgi:predicted nucleic acid-binding protein
MSEAGPDVLGPELVAPPLLWSEVYAGLHVRLWKGTMRRSDVEASRQRFGAMPIERRQHDDLHAEAWAIAEELGVARTYGCEYLALARLLGTKVVTLDGRLRRGADRLGLVTDPTEL